MAEVRNFSQPDEVLETPKRKAATVRLGRGDATLTRLEPGWSFRGDFQKHVGTELCQIDHFEYVVSGRLRVRTADGQEVEVAAGDVMAVPPGHEGWVVGDEPFVSVALFPK